MHRKDTHTVTIDQLFCHIGSGE